MKIGLIPLDERPVNIRYPQMLAQATDTILYIPPATCLSNWRKPADSAALMAWLSDTAPSLDVLIVSIEMLGYGGLIASRITHEPVSAITARLDQLRTLKQAYPHLKIWAFNVITRISNANNNIEEPDYWDQYGERLYQYSQLAHKVQSYPDLQTQLTQVQADIPPDHLTDFTQRRLRNHQVNLYVLDLLAADVFDFLILSSDDTSEFGFGSQEKAWLSTWVARLGLPPSKLLMYPGADEVGCVMLARALLQGNAPSFFPSYAIPDDRYLIAPYEDCPIEQTVSRQVQAIGGELTHQIDTADFILAVNTPAPCRCEQPDANPANEQAYRTAPLTQFVKQINKWLNAGKQVMLADVAYPNGADQTLMPLLREHVNITGLIGYGAWNTAGNTIGTVLAQAVITNMAKTPQQNHAAQQFMIHRLIEDDFYQGYLREQVRNWLDAEIGQRDPTPDTLDITITKIETRLQDALNHAQFTGWHLYNVRLPWNRTFEIDFDLVFEDKPS